MKQAVLQMPKRFLVGRPLRTGQMGETLLPKKLALPVFCSDPLSSVAYATEEILLALSLGGLAMFYLSWWVGAGVVFLLLVVTASYRQTCHAYPNGGGAYTVSRANLGENASLVAASALLIDYVLTVAVSVAAGVANIVSAFPALGRHAVLISLVLIAVLAVMNLRGVRESGTAFAIPTYGFVASVFLMLAVGLVRVLAGHGPTAESAAFGVHATHSTMGAAAVLLALRAFAQGCTALTGVEAVSNGVPNFKPPKSRNAATTLTIMGLLAVTMFGGITVLALAAHVHIADNPAQLVGAPQGYEQKTVIAQLGAAVFGHGSVFFFLAQAFTAAILVLAANTAFNGFPILASILGGDGYLPRQFARRGDRLVFSNGIVILSLLAGALVWAFDASTTRLIQLYIIGVFVSFTLSQSGMVRHWGDELRRLTDPAARRSIHRSRAINLVGALLTGLVLVIVLLTKFMHGAWIVVVTMPLVFLMMKGIQRHYRRVAAELEPGDDGVPLPSRIHAVVLVSKVHTPTLRAVAFARATRPNTLTALSVATSQEEADRLERAWAERDIPVPLTILDSPYRDITGPVLDYVTRIRLRSPRDVVCVFIPEYVVGRWWEHLLHNQSAFRLKARLLFRTGVMVTSVPWQLGSAEAALARQGEGAEFAGRTRVRPGAA
ncbi:APC family permease [Actinoallomurus purpureus]|uniref:APC family permease n=1 Tax=Actinoallomurus purpureus TaxID=478114 RepID=UPI002093EF63|nr:APC family permease [Actinoallomurus purpureus]MCO6009706.1 APC family permease [Actinoallomurus purpureus]